jgi:glycine cleavage system regulatory protein
MQTHLIVTLACPDRPGIVERITDVISNYSANWEESRLARLGGDFAGIIKIGVADEQSAALADALRSMADGEMTVIVKRAEQPRDDDQQTATVFDLLLAGADHEGIVHEVAHYLAGHGINVETMETEVVRAPMSASPLFHMLAQIKVPGTLPPAELSANLERIGEQLGVDIEIRSATDHRAER